MTCPSFFTVKMETLCSRFCADISIITHHIGISLHKEAREDKIEIEVKRFGDSNCQSFDSRHSPEDPMSISPPVPEITA